MGRGRQLGTDGLVSALVGQKGIPKAPGLGRDALGRGGMSAKTYGRGGVSGRRRKSCPRHMQRSGGDRDYRTFYKLSQHRSVGPEHKA